MKIRNYAIEKVVNVTTNKVYYQLVREWDKAILCAYQDVSACVSFYDELRERLSYDSIIRILSDEVIVKTEGVLKLSDLNK